MIRGRRGHHEPELAPSEPQLDRAGRQLDRDLLGGDRQRVLQRQPDRGVQRRGEALRELPSLLATRLSDGIELRVDALDVRLKFHGTMMAPLWCHVNA
jgi:hypothetical protein